MAEVHARLDDAARHALTRFPLKNIYLEEKYATNIPALDADKNLIETAFCTIVINGIEPISAH